MKIRNLITASALTATLMSCSAPATTDVAPYEGAITQIPFQEVSLDDSFWLPRLETQKKTLVPFSLDKTAFVVENLRRVGAYLRGERVTEQLVGRYYVASDLFKVMEGAAYLPTLEKDEALESQMERLSTLLPQRRRPTAIYMSIISCPSICVIRATMLATGHTPL